MQVKMNQAMVDMDGKEIKEMISTGQKNVLGNDIMTEGASLTLAKITINALVAQYEDERNLSGEEKVKRWQLAMLVRGNQEEVNLIVEDVALIKKLIAKAYGPLIVGQSWGMLENG